MRIFPIFLLLFLALFTYSCRKRAASRHKTGVIKAESNGKKTSPADCSAIKRANPYRYNECKRVYLQLIKKPDAFKKKPTSYDVVEFSDFLGICMKQKSEEKGSFTSTFRVSRNLIAELRNEGRFELADFLERKFFNESQKGLTNCRVKAVILNSNFSEFKGRVKLILKKLTKEEYQTEIDRTEFKIGRGIYQLNAFSKNMYGSSNPFKCDGKYIYVVVVLNPAI